MSASRRMVGVDSEFFTKLIRCLYGEERYFTESEDSGLRGLILGIPYSESELEFIPDDWSKVGSFYSHPGNPEESAV